MKFSSLDYEDYLKQGTLITFHLNLNNFFFFVGKGI